MVRAEACWVAGFVSDIASEELPTHSSIDQTSARYNSIIVANANG